MKVFFDTNVYVAEALLGETAQQLVEATLAAAWRIYTTPEVLHEIERVLPDRLGSSRRFAVLTRKRVQRRATVVVARPGRHRVPDDPADRAVLLGALACGADYLVTNDDHLLSLHPYESLQIVSMSDFRELLENQGLWP